MKGWQIFLHSLRQVFGNFGAAIKISAVPYLIIVAATVALGISNWSDPKARGDAVANGTFPWGRLALFCLIWTVSWYWIAVAWHRFVLLNERPGAIPAFRVDRVWAYFLRSLKVSLFVIPLALVIGLVFGFVGAFVLHRVSQVIAVQVMTFTALALMFPFLYRLTASMPAAALGAPETVSDAWRATAGQFGALFVVTLLLIGGSTILRLAGSSILGGTIFGTIWGYVIDWIAPLIGVSILTTLYGHYIEKRPLI